MFKSTIKPKLAEYFLLCVFTCRRTHDLIKAIVSLIPVLIFLAGCEDRGQTPIITTIYIEENSKSSSATEANSHNLDIDSSESEQKTKILQSDDMSVENISSKAEKIAKMENKSQITQKRAVSNIQSEKTLEPLNVPSIEPPRIEELKRIKSLPDNTSQNELLESNEKKQEKLEMAALEAAFEMLAKKAEPAQIAPKTSNYRSGAPEEIKFRIGLLVPLSGPFSYLGDTISGGSELAFFKMQNPNVELLYFDTAGGDKIIDAFNRAVSNDVDVIIGPLFSDSVSAIKPFLKTSDIPILSFSNNIDVAEPGIWVLGYLPEQQIAQLVDFAVARGKQNFGIVSSSSELGNKITRATKNQLTKYDLSPRTVVTINDIASMEQNELLNQIKIFAQYIDSDKDPLTLPPPAFDTVVIAGDTNFILQVAPILSYYDLGPDRALFIGIDKWNRPKMLNEPSLQNALLTLPTRPADDKFNKVWKSEFKIEANDLAKISFDATALVIATAAINSEASLSERLVSQPGFIGFSGQFKMSKSGLTERVFEIMEISDNFLVKPSIQ